jgi:hypothetical protein
MTAMSRLVFIPALSGLLVLTGCREEQSLAVTKPEPEAFESEAVLQLHPSSMIEGEIDWTGEAEFLQGPEIFERLAFMLEADQLDLREAVRFEFDVLEAQVRVIARHGEKEQAQAISQGFANLYLELRKKAEVAMVQKRLTKLDVQLENERAEYQKRQAELQKLLQEYRNERFVDPEKGKTLEQDRMTYEKALEALEDDPDKEGDVPDDGILFRKEKEKDE